MTKQFLPSFFNSSISRSPTQVVETEKTLEEEGIDEHIKNQAIKIEADRQSVDELVKSSNRCVISISSIFP